jgi:hypothetical protein
MALVSKYRLEQFSKVLDLRNSEGKPYLLVGGQAVNYWAERYIEEDPNLEELQPFTSEDIDFKGNRSDVEFMAKQLDLVPAFPNPKEMTSLAGAIPIRLGTVRSNIEVVRRIPGAPPNAEKAAIEVEWNGKQLRLLDPVSLFASKLRLLATVSQADRQDARHLKILVRCVRCFLGELLQEVHRGGIPSRHWLNLVGYLLRITSTKPAIRIASDLGLSWRDSLPWDAIDASPDPKIVRFAATSSTDRPNG